MKPLSRDSLPHSTDCLVRLLSKCWYLPFAVVSAKWWGVSIGPGGEFFGKTRFKRHPNSRISIGPGCKFNSSPFANLMGLNRACMISTLKQGATVTIGEGCGFSGTVITCGVGISLGANVRCGANTSITDTDFHYDDPRRGSDRPVIIEDNVWLGCNVVVLKGVSIGENTLVGAGSLVTKSLPAGVVAAGNPAKVISPL